MPISPKTAEVLRNMGHHAVRLTDLGMMSAEDEKVVEYALKHNYVIVTMDLDFVGIIAHNMLGKPSVITFRLENPEVARINNILEDTLQGIEGFLEKGAIVTVEEFRVRVRELPV